MYALAIILFESSSLQKTCPVSILTFEPYLLSLSLVGEEWGEIMMGFLVLILSHLGNVYKIHMNTSVNEN